MCRVPRDRRDTLPEGVVPSGLSDGSPRQSDSTLVSSRIGMALEEVGRAYWLSLYEVAKNAHGHLSANYLYKIRSGQKSKPSFEVIRLIVSGIENARGKAAAAYFLTLAFGFNENDYNAGMQVTASVN